MNHRHATSLALVGWYFMAPPFSALNEPRFSQWDIIGSFDTATACEKAREFMLDKISDPQFQAWTKANAEKNGQKFDKKAGRAKNAFLSLRFQRRSAPQIKVGDWLSALLCWDPISISGNFHDADDGAYLSGGNTIGSGGWEAGQERLCFVAISPMTRSQRSFPKLL